MPVETAFPRNEGDQFDHILLRSQRLTSLDKSSVCWEECLIEVCSTVYWGRGIRA